MIIRSVTIEQFAAFRGPITLELEKGLNVIYGPNETGKSTLMRAIWFALTRRASSRAREIEAIIPYGGGTPEVRVEWTQGARTFTLTKRFSDSDPLTRLEERTAEGSLTDHTGEDADARIRHVLGFGAPSGTTKTPAHFGLWPVTWVRQHDRTSDPGRRLEEEGDRESLSEVLAELTGQVLAGEEGEGLMERVREEYEQFYTSTGNETSRSGAPLHEARQVLEAAREEKARLQERQQQYENDLDRFEALRTERKELEQELPDVKKEAREAAEQRERVQQVRGALETAEARVENARSTLQTFRNEKAEREDLRDAIEETEEILSERKNQLEQRTERLEAHRRKRSDLEDRREEVEARRSRARERARLLEAHQTVLLGRDRLSELDARLERALDRQEELTEARTRLEQIAVDEEVVEELESLLRQRDKAEATLDSAAAEVRLRGRGEVRVQIGDEDAFELAAGDEKRRSIDAPTTILVADRLEMEVVPGGDQLSQVKRAAEEARTALQDALERVEVDSLEEARRRLRERSRLASRIEDLESLIEEAAPQGVEALREKRARENQALEEARRRREEDAEKLEVELPEDEEGVRAALQEAREESEEAERRLDEVREELGAHDQEAEQLKSKVQVDRERVSDLERQLEDRKETLADRTEEMDAEALEENMHEAEAELRSEREEVEDLREELEDLDAGDVETRLERAERAVRNTEEELGSVREELAGLRARLGSVELHGLHERLEGASQEVEKARQEVRRWEQRAEATKLLYETLEESRAEVQREFLAPLREEVEDLLGQFFGVSEVGLQFGEDFSLGELTRRSEGSFAFDLLSTGAREQLALIVRLGMARLLAREEPLPVFLDEALADTDPDRFEAMANLIRRVSEEVQIVLTTCHKQRFRRVGADREIDLEAEKRRAAAEEAG